MQSISGSAESSVPDTGHGLSLRRYTLGAIRQRKSVIWRHSRLGIDPVADRGFWGHYKPFIGQFGRSSGLPKWSAPYHLAQALLGSAPVLRRPATSKNLTQPTAMSPRTYARGTASRHTTLSHVSRNTARCRKDNEQCHRKQ